MKCPNCKIKLIVKFVSVNDTITKHFICTNCDYCKIVRIG